MKIRRCKKSPTMLVTILLVLSFMFSSSRAIRDPTINSSTSYATIHEQSNLETYVVFLQIPESMMSRKREDIDSWYRSFLPATASSSNQRLVYSYHNVVTGFAAKLTAQEAKSMEAKEGFVSTHLERILNVHTTHTPKFLGLQQNLGFWNHSNYGKGVIIGVVDTGVTPNHPSFDDEGMPPPPAKWKGKCDFGSLCNNKLIGARNFYSSGAPPLDGNGHGTHTASTAAGSPVQGASFYGQLNGTAVGIAPSAHLAIYQVCSAFGSCRESDVLAGMDAAVEDGVDVLSLSLGGPSVPFYEDSIAIGAFGAIQRGIFVSCAAGNSGPYAHSLSNEAPWILTVGASTVDRSIRATVVLGTNAQYDGQSYYQPQNFSSALLPLVYAGANGSESAANCDPGSLGNIDVKGKVVLCEGGGFSTPIDKGQEVKNAGGAAMIVMNDELSGNLTTASMHLLPASDVTYADGLSIKAYINSTSSPIATILFKGTVFGIPYAPQVAYFSSRGPSSTSPGILKPDIIGPGYHILAAWPHAVDNNNNTKSTFNVISGTSMATPHLTGTAALLKSSHPDWSPAAIKSAMMTTANLTNLGGTPITDQYFNPVDVFDIGSGHVNPSKADDPGLIYDIQPDDYIPYLCGLGYNDTEVGTIVQRLVTCSNGSSIPEAQLNYPSFSIKLGSSSQTYSRTVTNVGPAQSSYTAEIIAPPGVDVTVTPNAIAFKGVNLTATYSVTFSRQASINVTFAQGYLNWVSDQHVVRSPIAVLFE